MSLLQPGAAGHPYGEVVARALKVELERGEDCGDWWFGAEDGSVRGLGAGLWVDLSLFLPQL